MEKELIAKKAYKMENKNDLLELLNSIKLDDAAQMGVQFFPFTTKQINYYCNPNHVFHRYQQFKIKKKSGGFRLITAPRNNTFKLLLQYVNIILKSIYTPSDYAMGFAERRSVVTNAEKHLGQNYVLNIDLKDFFPSIDQARVWKRLQLAPFNFPVKVASILAGLCCMKTSIEEEGKSQVRYVLPQGAPTSPIITNMICDTLDRRLAGLAKRFGLRYSRYADDITFSSMHNVYKTNGEFWTELRRIISGQNFTINETKTRLQKRGSRQEATGIIVNEKLNITQKYVRDIRNILYIWEHYGYSSAFTRFFPKYKAEKGHVKKGMPDLINVLSGKLMYLKMVKGKEDNVYPRLYHKFEYLANQANCFENTTEQGITYLDTTPLKEFEEKNSTEVTIIWTEPKEDKNGQLKPARRTASFILDGKKVFVSVNRSVKQEDEAKKELLAISSCRNAKNEQFMLIHYANKVTVPTVDTIDIEELNKELDALLNTDYG